MSLLLYQPQRHETISKAQWCPQAVHNEINAIIADLQGAMSPQGSWPTHPLDAESYTEPGPKWAAYAGAAGAIQGLNILREYGFPADDKRDFLPRIHKAFLQTPDVSVQPGLQIGEIGILAPLVLAQPQACQAKQRLLQCMSQTLALPYYEITAGQTGMMHAALALYKHTAQKCWQEMYLLGAKSLMQAWSPIDDSAQWLWQSEVFGFSRHYYGACHGVAGNTNALLQGAELLDKELVELALERCIHTLELSACCEQDMLNWPLSTKPHIDKFLVQWCHGAAGIVTSLAKANPRHRVLSTKLERILKMAGQLIWQAGPLKKGPGICHGSAGNGYAFLYLYQRWGESIWLQRARQFAMHCIEQCQQTRSIYAQGRYSLWTGDVGVAIYLYHCLHPEQAAIPGLELF